MSQTLMLLLLIILSCSASTAFALAPDEHTNATHVVWERTPSREAAVLNSGKTLSQNATLFFLFTGILSCAMASFLIVRSQKRETSPADEYVIIEDIIEGADDE